MPKKTKTIPVVPTHVMARDFVDQYFAARRDRLLVDIPEDDGLGECSFWDQVWLVKQALFEADTQKLRGSEEAAIARAGYLLGVEVGRRLGGAR